MSRAYSWSETTAGSPRLESSFTRIEPGAGPQSVLHGLRNPARRGVKARCVIALPAISRQTRTVAEERRIHEQCVILLRLLV